MFLNARISPYVINNNVEQLWLHGTLKGHSDPLLLCSSDVWSFEMPRNWCGTAYGTQETVNCYDSYCKTKECNPTKIDFKVLMPYRPEVILLDSKPIEITAIPTGVNRKGYCVDIFLIEKNWLRILAINELPFGLDWLMGEYISNRLIGIDVVYLNDLLYANWTQSPKELEQQRDHQTLINIVQAIRPKQVRGLLRADLPQSLLNICATEEDVDLQ